MEFEWDDEKAETNLEKHDVSFAEAATLWLDPFALEIPDLDHSANEERWIRMGASRAARILVVVYLEKIESERIRLISARKATRTEIAQYRWRQS